MTEFKTTDKGQRPSMRQAALLMATVEALIPVGSKVEYIHDSIVVTMPPIKPCSMRLGNPFDGMGTARLESWDTREEIVAALNLPKWRKNGAPLSGDGESIVQAAETAWAALSAAGLDYLEVSVLCSDNGDNGDLILRLELDDQALAEASDRVVDAQ